VEAAIGLAATNAFYNRYDLEAPAANGLDAMVDETPLTVIGRFPNLPERLPGARVIERQPQEGEYPEAAAGWLLAESERVVATASTLVNHSLPGLIAAAPHTRFALVGPSTPLTPRLHAYGLDRLAGMVVTDPKGAARAVAEGGSVKTLKPYARMAMLTDPEAG
jgi:hypothetical protein